MYDPREFTFRVSEPASLRLRTCASSGRYQGCDKVV
jgi:hypothetical protein